jgi:hypothetical protein
MRRVRFVSLVMLSVFVLGVVGAASASAAALPEFKNETAGTGKSNATSNLVSGAGDIECGKLRATTGKGKKSGTFTVDFLGCSSPGLGSGSECHSLGDELGTILTGGTWDLVPGPAQSPAAPVLFLVTELHLECKNKTGSMTSLVILKGSVLGKISPLGSLVLAFEVNVNAIGTEKTEQELKAWENDSGGTEKPELLEALNGSSSFQKASVNAPKDELGMLVSTNEITG